MSQKKEEPVISSSFIEYSVVRKPVYSDLSFINSCFRLSTPYLAEAQPRPASKLTVPINPINSSIMVSPGTKQFLKLHLATSPGKASLAQKSLAFIGAARNLFAS
jgi:hypothetical protein